MPAGHETQRRSRAGDPHRAPRPRL